jgi:glutaredoxin 3
MDEITLYTQNHCPFCRAAKSLLEQRGLDHREIDVGKDGPRLAEMMHLSGRWTVPQIFFGDRHIGGFDDLQAYFQAAAPTLDATAPLFPAE